MIWTLVLLILNGKEYKIPFAVLLPECHSVKPENHHSNCQVKLFQQFLRVHWFTEFSGGRGGCSGSSGSSRSSGIGFSKNTRHFLYIFVPLPQPANIYQIFFNHDTNLHPIQISMNVKIRTVAVNTNAWISQEAISVNVKQDSKFHGTTEVEGTALVSKAMKSFTFHKHTHITSLSYFENCVVSNGTYVDTVL